MDQTLVAAHGKMVALVACVLQGSGVTTTEEFSRLLTMFSEVVCETNPQEGEILALWADTVAAMLPPQPRH